MFGREMTREIFKEHAFKTWDEEKVKALGVYLSQYMISTWKEYYNPDVYIDADLENPYDLYEKSWESIETRAFRHEVSQKVMNYFKFIANDVREHLRMVIG